MPPEVALILPMLGLMLWFFGAWILGHIGIKANDKVRSRVGAGAPEFPFLVSFLLEEAGPHGKLEWSEGGRSVVYTFGQDCGFDVVKYARDKLHDPWRSDMNREILADFEAYSDWVDALQIEAIDPEPKTGCPRVLITPHKSFLNNPDYWRMEIANLGRLFITNTVGNTCRWMLPKHDFKDNTVTLEDGEWVVRVNRIQSKPTLGGLFGDWHSASMSKKQINQNLSNHLWRHYTATCRSIDDDRYKGVLSPA